MLHNKLAILDNSMYPYRITPLLFHDNSERGVPCASTRFALDPSTS
jgi:hypothetical protein